LKKIEKKALDSEKLMSFVLRCGSD